MPWPPDGVSEDIMFFGLSVHLFFWTNLVTTISHGRPKQSRRNLGLQGIFTSPYWWPD